MEQDVIEQQQSEQTQTTGAEQAQEQQQEQKAVPEWATRRFGELTAARKAAEQRAADLERQLAQAQQQPATQEHQPTHQNVEALARMYAEQIADQIAEQKVKEQSFHQSIQSIERAGKDAYGEEFDRSISNLQMAGVGSQEFLQALAAIPNPEKVVHWLGRPENMEQAVQIASLPGMQMAIELTKLAPQAAKGVAKAVSRAPAPISPLDGGGGASGGEPRLGTPEWFAWRNESARRK